MQMQPELLLIAICSRWCHFDHYLQFISVNHIAGVICIVH